MYSTIKFEVVDKVGVLTLNRPDARNAVNRALREEVLDVLAKSAKSEEINVLLIAAEGKSFCAGRDLSEVKEMGQREMTALMEDYAELKSFTDAFERFEKPIIAAVQGHALGMGNSLVTYCDLVLASDGAKFGFPEINLNIVPGIASVQAARVVGKLKLSEMILLGKKYSAQEALEMGMVNAVVPAEELFDTALGWAKQLAALDPFTVRISKLFIKHLGEAPYDYDAFSSIGIMSMGFANKNKR